MGRSLDREAAAGFASFYARELRSLHQLSLLLSRSPADAEDLLQETVARMLRAWPRVQGFERPDAYARTVMINAARRGWRVSSRLPEVPLDGMVEPVRLDVALTAAVDADELAGHLATLGPRQRQVLVARFYLDLSEQQTAAALGCSVGTVKSQQSRALAALRRRLQPLELASALGRARRGQPDVSAV